MGLIHTYIAIIDSDPNLCNSWSRLLRAADFVPISYRTAEEFFEDPVHEFFSAVMVDYELGGMSGLEFQRRLGLEKREIAVVFITSNEDPEVRETVLREGCAGFFLKTHAGSEIIACLRQACLASKRMRV